MAKGKKKANAKTKKAVKENKPVAAAEKKETVTVVDELAEPAAKAMVAEPVAEVKAEKAAPVAVDAPAAPKKAAPKAATTEKAADKKSAAKKTAKPAVKKAAEAKKPGRKPMTEQEKADARKEREAMKAAAANMKPKFVLQFQGQDADLEQLAEAAAADFKAKRKRTPLTELKIYLVPENGMAYYVANGSIEGSIPL